MRLQQFAGDDLTATIAKIERSISGLTYDLTADFLSDIGATLPTLQSATTLKRAVGQINVSIHALGILLCLPHILRPGETVQGVSLGAGNTGRVFDLETDQRVAEFKFISWKGGAESIRQNSLFKDYFFLAEDPTPKEKYLYVLGTEHPLKFFNGRRSLSSVLSKDARTALRFHDRFGTQFTTVRDYFEVHSHAVGIVDVSNWIPEFANNVVYSD